MTIDLLYIIVPAVLILAVVIIIFNSRSKRMMKEMTSIRTQLEGLENKTSQAEELPPVEEKAAEPAKEPEPETEPVAEPEPEGEVEIKDAPEESDKGPEASAYNTGKSGKIYTKEELELLIKE